MKKRFILFISFMIMLLLPGCSPEDLPFLNKTDFKSTSYDINDFEFIVEKILLSKGYQNTNPRVELVSKLDENRLMVFPGLIKSSGMDISDISIEDKVVNISIINSLSSSAKLVVPQISVLIKKADKSELKDLSFNIINENYQPINIDYGIVDVLNKVQADFKVSADSYPTINLIQKDNSILWKIDYDNIFDINNKENPIIDLELLVNSSNGEVVKSNKELISTLIDQGEILSFDQEYGFIYSKVLVENKVRSTELWFYDFLDKKKKKIYTCQSEVTYAKFRPDGLAIAFIEKNADLSIPYIIELKDKRVTKVVLEENQMPEQIDWKSNSEISILTSFKDNQSNILVYDTKDNTLETTLLAIFDIAYFSQFDDKLLISEYMDSTKNNTIKFWMPEKGFIIIGPGYSPQIINNDFGAYIEKDENSDMESLHILNLNTLEVEFTISDTVKAFKPISSKEVYITETSQENSFYKASILDLDTNKLKSIGNINSSKTFYHKNSKLVYANLSIPYAENSSKVIFSIPKNKLKRR